MDKKQIAKIAKQYKNVSKTMLIKEIIVKETKLRQLATELGMLFNNNREYQKLIAYLVVETKKLRKKIRKIRKNGKTKRKSS